MDGAIALIGFGEAGKAFAHAGRWGARARAYDKLTDRAETRSTKQAEYVTACVMGADTPAAALAEATLILSLVTAEHALEAAQAAAGVLMRGALYCDMNSVAPATKCAAAAVIEAGGGHYVDVAIMAPVLPTPLATPLLLSGQQAGQACERLHSLGFTNQRVVGSEIGRASTIKMIRSVMIKGMEALTAECLIAAECASVRDEVLSSLDAAPNRQLASARADYDLDRMLVHGLRRASEMEEAARTLESLGIDPVMTRGTIVLQRELGKLGNGSADLGLDKKLARIAGSKAAA